MRENKSGTVIKYKLRAAGLIYKTIYRYVTAATEQEDYRGGEGRRERMEETERSVVNKVTLWKRNRVNHIWQLQ